MSSCFFLLLYTCQVTDESELLSYQQQLQEWERLEEEERHTFTITDTAEKVILVSYWNKNFNVNF